MRGSQSQDRKGKLLFAKITGAKLNERVHFELSSKETKESALVQEGTERSLSGRLTRAEVRKWEYQGEPKDSIVLYLTDPKAGTEGETYRIEISMGGMARSIINSLMSAEHFDQKDDVVTLRLYNNKKGYAAVFVGLGLDGFHQPIQLPWKLSIDDQNVFITKEKKKSKDEKGKIVEKITNNYIELDTHFLEQFQNFVVSKVKSNSPPAPVEETVGGPSPETVDDLPF